MHTLNCFVEKFSIAHNRLIFQHGPETPHQAANEPVRERAPEERGNLEADAGQTKERLKDFDAETSRKILSDPAKLKELLLSEINGNFITYPSFRRMLERLRTDTPFLKNLIETYANNDDEYGSVCSVAIEVIDLADDDFFKKIFETSTDGDIRSLALIRIQDEKYRFQKIMEYLSDYRGEETYPWGNLYVGFRAIRSLSNIQYLKKISEVGGYPGAAAEMRLEELGHYDTFGKPGSDAKKLLKSAFDRAAEWVDTYGLFSAGPGHF